METHSKGEIKIATEQEQWEVAGEEEDDWRWKRAKYPLEAA